MKFLRRIKANNSINAGVAVTTNANAERLIVIIVLLALAWKKLNKKYEKEKCFQMSIGKSTSLLNYFCSFSLLFLVGSNLVFAFNKQINLTEKDKKTMILSILKRTNFEKSNDSETIYISKENIPNSIFDELSEINGKKIVYLSSDEVEEKTKYGFTYWAFLIFDVKKDKVSVNFVKSFLSSESGNTRSAGLSYDYKKSNGKWRGKIQRYILGLS